MKIRWTHPARRDLESIVDYVGQNNPRAAAALLDRILDRVETLAVHPELGRPGRVVGTRELVIADTPFLVPYRLNCFSGVAALAGEFSLTSNRMASA